MAGKGQRSRGLLLAGDIGGTKTVLGLFEPDGTRLLPRARARYQSRDHAGLEGIVDDFLARSGRRVAAAAFGVAGPVIAGRSRATNLPWIIDAARLSRRLGGTVVTLLNDLEATAHAIPHLGRSKLHFLNKGTRRPDGTIAVVAAGTGLGEAFVVRKNGRFMAGATEGGHADFAPRTDQEIDLLRYLERRHGHVSVERVLSGPGLVALYDFLGESRDWPGEAEPSGRRDGERTDRAAAISGAALDGSSPRARETLRLFASIYGAEAGNVALRYFATGGVYLSGGIAPKILPALGWPDFLEAFRSKGRFAGFLGRIPVAVVLDEAAALLGAARAADLGRRA